MPFVSEEIWQVIRPYLAAADLAPNLVIAKFPKPREDQPLSEAEALAMVHCIEATEAVNSLRALVGIHPGQRVSAIIRPRSGVNGDSHAGFAAEIERFRNYAATMAKIDSLEIYPADKPLPSRTITSVLEWCEVSIKAPDGFDFDKARTVIKKKLGEVTGHHEQHLKRLGNPDFLAKAAPEMREETQQRAHELETQRRLLSEQLRILGEAQ